MVFSYGKMATWENGEMPEVRDWLRVVSRKRHGLELGGQLSIWVGVV